MPAKKKKSKAAAGTARGFATVSTASKARVNEVEQEQTAKEEIAQTPIAKDASSIVHLSGDAQLSKEQNLASLSPEELETKLEDNELQVFLDKYGEPVRKEAGRHATRLKTDRRLLRAQAADLNVRPWLSQELIVQILDQVEADERRVSQHTKPR